VVIPLCTLLGSPLCTLWCVLPLPTTGIVSTRMCTTWIVLNPDVHNVEHTARHCSYSPVPGRLFVIIWLMSETEHLRITPVINVRNVNNAQNVGYPAGSFPQNKPSSLGKQESKGRETRHREYLCTRNR